MLRNAESTDPSWFSRFVPPDDGGRESAVLLLFGPDLDGAESLLLIERSHDMRSHPGQVALPGGATEPGDADAVATALREATEEVNLDAGRRRGGRRPAAAVPATERVRRDDRRGLVGHTGAGIGRRPAEVAQVLQAPLDFLTDPAVRHTVTHPSGYRGPAFQLGDDLLLWGFTAGVVTKALELADLDRSWDEAREVPLPERFLRGRS